MEWFIVAGLLACFLCPVLLWVVFFSVLFYLFWSVGGWAILIPIGCVIWIGFVGMVFEPIEENNRKKVKQALDEYNAVKFRWYNSDEYWEQQRKSQKKPSKATLDKCSRILAEQKNRTSKTLPIAKDYLKKKGLT